MKKRFALILAAALASSAILSACGENQASETQAPAQETQTDAGGDSEAGAENTSGPKDEVVTMAIISSWDTLNIYNTSGNYGNAVADHMFERLVTRTHDGEILPRLATSWEMSEDTIRR